MHPYSLSNKERIIMKILWESNNPLTASEICKIDSTLSINTVQASLKKLLSNEFITIGDIVYSGTVLTRSYTTSISADEYASMQLKEHYKFFNKKSSISNIVSCLLDKDEHEESELDELQKMIDDRRNREG